MMPHSIGTVGCEATLAHRRRSSGSAPGWGALGDRASRTRRRKTGTFLEELGADRRFARVSPSFGGRRRGLLGCAHPLRGKHGDGARTYRAVAPGKGEAGIHG